MLFDVGKLDSGRGGDIAGACDFFLRVLEDGPVNPAGVGKFLTRFRVGEKLGDFVRDHMGDQVVLAGNVGGSLASPNGQPALALRSKFTDAAYWRRYRTTIPDGDDVEAVWGTIVRLSYKGAGLIVELDGRVRPCLLPTANIPLAYRTRQQSLLGLRARFQVVSDIPELQSTLLRFAGPIPAISPSSEEEAIPSTSQGVVSGTTRGNVHAQSDDAEKRRLESELNLLKKLFADEVLRRQDAEKALSFACGLLQTTPEALRRRMAASRTQDP